MRLPALKVPGYFQSVPVGRAVVSQIIPLLNAG